ncbi:MAG: CD1247 N-terminal domain-containing protein [Symbiobacterium sp.]|uniref:CD1247 N-terminal domain-containing protein n=1 Tax=Symbiobacterium sp. TaxID=1971213 RepID=UPI00346488D7
MNDLRSRVAYLQGLAEGLDLDVGSAEGRVLSGILEVLDEFAAELGELAEFHGQLADYVDEMDDDLSAVEAEVYNDQEVIFVPEAALVEDEDGVSMIRCPECGETVGASAGQMASDELEVTCPVCGCRMEADEDD